jgi:uncharacterized protein with FMN-binding domain
MAWLYAVSDLHVAHPKNGAIVEGLFPLDEEDWLLLAPSAPAPSGSSGTSSDATGSSGSSGAATGTRSGTGDSVQTRYGPVQVRVTLENGKLTGVTAVTYPQDNPGDQQINSYAVPQLTREALTAQSADIDTVSGATYASDGYRQSLQSALDSAGR